MLVVTVLKESFPQIFSLKLVTLDKRPRSRASCTWCSLDLSHFSSKQDMLYLIAEKTLLLFWFLPPTISQAAQTEGSQLKAEANVKHRFFLLIPNLALLKLYHISNLRKG